MISLILKDNELATLPNWLIHSQKLKKAEVKAKNLPCLQIHYLSSEEALQKCSYENVS